MMLYLLLLLGTILEGEFTMVAIGFAVHQGHLDIRWVTAVAAVGAFLGDWLWFEVGRRKGTTWLNRFPKWAERAQRLSEFMARRPIIALLFLRFQIGMRTVGHLVIGAGPLTHARYLPINAVACVLWALFIAGLCRAFAALMTGLWQMVGI